MLNTMVYGPVFETITWTVFTSLKLLDKTLLTVSRGVTPRNVFIANAAVTVVPTIVWMNQSMLDWEMANMITGERKQQVLVAYSANNGH